MKKIDSDKNDPFTRNDIESEIKLINRKIQKILWLLEKEKSENKSRLENIKEKIKIFKEPKFNQDISLVASHAKQLFFNGKAERDNSIPELKTQAIKNCI